MNLFIDTNIFLDFYHLSGADIEELHKLTALLEDGGLKLFVPRQLCEEFKRNRDGKIKDAMNEFKKAKFTISFPAFCKLYPEYKELQDTLKAANTKHAELYQKAMDDVNAVALKADAVIGELFGKAQVIETGNPIFNKALLRFRMGNPPGKKKVTIGDEVNWESLLEAVPNGEDLHLVSGDSDFAAAMDADKFNPFLDDEWKTKKEASIIFHKSLQDFFKANYPQIKLASDVKKNMLIEKLAKSGSFATTHLVVDKLGAIDDFSPAQVEQLIQIADMNNQVGWIIGDDDVLAFYKKLTEKYADAISAESLGTLNQLLPENEQPENDDDIPF
ncbi:DUF4935 domain-containing protein [Rhizobium leguminosarum]|uniref:DUF4935 domain-containing protein n=1 Tax=Rhizobium leguminosarum TaxID=384 RepID=A0A6P0DHA0_RHILE|nr:PIN domain-containing protein [Rhizobium leguminosarum]NEK50836.1 DUF4935 domain-containing protein [Rhizobium leguminosarum]